MRITHARAGRLVRTRGGTFGIEELERPRQITSEKCAFLLREQAIGEKIIEDLRVIVRGVVGAGKGG